MARVTIKTERLLNDIKSGKAFEGMVTRGSHSDVASVIATLVLGAIARETEELTEGLAHSATEAWRGYRVEISSSTVLQVTAEQAHEAGINLGDMVVAFDKLAKEEEWFTFDHWDDMMFFVVDCDINEYAVKLRHWVFTHRNDTVLDWANMSAYDRRHLPEWDEMPSWMKAEFLLCTVYDATIERMKSLNYCES